MTSHAPSHPEKTMIIDLFAHLGAPLPSSSINRYITSPALTPLELALLRLLFSLYAFFTIFFSLGYESTSASTSEKFGAEHFLSYFTNLCYWGIAFYFLLAGLHGLAYHFTLRRPHLASAVWRYLDLEQWPRGLRAAHSVLYSSVVTFAPLVTIVYWAVIYRGPFYPLRFDAWKNISIHALNTVFALLEILLPCTLPLPLLHLPLLILLLLLYLGLAYLTHAISHFYPYDFLDSETLGAGLVTGYCVAILAGVCAVFGIVWSLLWIKAWIIGDQQEHHLQHQQQPHSGSIREGAQGRAGIRRSGGGDGGVAAGRDSVLPYPVRPNHTRSVSGITAVNDDQDLEMGPQGRSVGVAAAGGTSDGSRSPVSPLQSPLPPGPPPAAAAAATTMPITRRSAGGEVIELDPVTSEFMRETAVGRSKK